MQVDLERARWIAQHILPVERTLRIWLGRQAFRDVEVDDVVQDVYARLTTAGGVGHIRNAKAYLFQVARSVLADHLRRSKIQVLHSAALYEDIEIEDAAPSPEDALIARNELTRLARVVAGFPEKTRKVFILRRVSGLSQREIAKRLNVSESTVEKQIAHGVRLLAKSYANDDAGDAGILTPKQESNAQCRGWQTTRSKAKQ